MHRQSRSQQLFSPRYFHEERPIYYIILYYELLTNYIREIFFYERFHAYINILSLIIISNNILIISHILYVTVSIAITINYK